MGHAHRMSELRKKLGDNVSFHQFHQFSKERIRVDTWIARDFTQTKTGFQRRQCSITTVPCYQVSIMPKRSDSHSWVEFFFFFFGGGGLSFKFTFSTVMLCTLLNILPPEAISIVLDPLSYAFLLISADHLLLHYFPCYSTPVGLQAPGFTNLLQHLSSSPLKFQREAFYVLLFGMTRMKVKPDRGQGKG